MRIAAMTCARSARACPSWRSYSLIAPRISSRLRRSVVTVLISAIAHLLCAELKGPSLMGVWRNAPHIYYYYPKFHPGQHPLAGAFQFARPLDNGALKNVLWRLRHNTGII